ncbi:MAG: LpqB family beta-propeller domain-containing protein [Acidobacteriota bacterium]
MNPGVAFGSFTVLGPLGRGAMGEVYRARDTRLGRDVAIKLLPEVFALDPDRLRRFEREAQALAALNHPNIAAIYGLEEAGPVPALVMELVDGETLEERLKSGPMPISEALPLAVQFAAALESAHEQGIIHRDLKPANIKIRPDGTLKVLDFGLAKMQAPESTASDLATVTASGTGAGVVLGSAAYMSPEQARGRPVDRRTDIWAFGCILMEMLSGERTFAGDTATDAIANILQREPAWTILPPGTPAWVRELLRRCLQKDVSKRLRDAGDARLEIEERLARPVAESVAEQPQRARGWRLPLSVAAALVAGIAAGAFGARSMMQPPDDPVPRFDRLTRIVATPAHESAPAISPDGKWVAYLSNARGPTDVWVKFVSGGDAVNLTATSGLEVNSQDYIGGLDISPDGSLVSFGAGLAGATQAQMATWVIPAPLGGVPRRLLGVSELGARWSPDGAHIAYTRAGGPRGDALWVADADGTNARQLVEMQGGRHIHWSRWSRDGSYVFFNLGFYNFNNGPTEIFRVKSSGGPAERVVQTVRTAAFPVPSADGRGLIYASNRDGDELALWWRNLANGHDERLTTGIGDYSEPYESADGRRIVGKFTNLRQSIWQLPVSRSVASSVRSLSDGSAGDIDPASSPVTDRIVFSSTRTGRRNLWSANPDMTQAVPITAGNFNDERPAVSGDGRQIAFVSDRGGKRGIWVVDAEGGRPRHIIDDNVLNTISWSPDGQRVVYAVGGGNQPSLRIVSVSDGRMTPLKTPAGAVSPAWSPVTDVIAYLEPRLYPNTVAINLVDSNGRSQQTAISGLNLSFANGFIAWSPDGSQIAAVSLPGNLDGTVWVIDARAARPRKIFDVPTDQFARGMCWLRDGSAILIGTVSSSGDIFLAERAPK